MNKPGAASRKKKSKSSPSPDSVSPNSVSPEVEAKHGRLVDRIGKLPVSVGVVLMGIGAAGLVIPGPFGTPFIIAGGLILAPRAFRTFDRFVQRRMPALYWTGMDVVDRFLQDMEKRYPSGDRRSEPGRPRRPT